MAVSSKDLETLWQRYKVEAVPASISVNQFFESNGIPYHVFEKWYKKKYQAPNVVDCVVQGGSLSLVFDGFRCRKHVRHRAVLQLL